MKNNLTEGQIFARKCSVTGQGMNEGYCIGDGEDYAIDDAALEKHFGWKSDAEKAKSYQKEEYYYTVWEEKSDYQYIVKNGELVEIEEQEITLQSVLDKIDANNIEAWQDKGDYTVSVVILDDFSKNDPNSGEEIDPEREYKYNGWLEDLKKLAEKGTVEVVKSKEHYFLFGSDICREFHEKETDEVIEYAKENGDFAVHKFIDGEHPSHMLEAFSGWGDYATISKELYESLHEIQEF